MRKSLNIHRIAIFGIVCGIAMQCALLAQDSNTLNQARALSDQALVSARAGNSDAALQGYRAALLLAPGDIAILRDYAVVLGWADKYAEAIRAVKALRELQNDQPVWALREFARSYLFGDETSEALRALDELAERGDDSEQTMTRRALALRWLGRANDAKAQYEAVLRKYPGSAPAVAGLSYAQSDQNKLAAAMQTLDSAPISVQESPEILQARIRILNLMGRHFEAQRLIETLPSELADTRDVIENRIAAERWGGSPSEAQLDGLKLWSLFPGKASRGLWDDIRTENGESFAPAFRYSKDSDGLTDRTASSDIAIHLNPAHVLHIGYQYRWLEQNQDVRSMVRYDLGWTGVLHRRIVAYATASQVDYRQPGVLRKWVGDASLAAAINDKIRLNGGSGRIVMDAFNAIGNQVSASFGFGEIAVRFTPGTRLRTRYSRYFFSDKVTRHRADAEVTQSVLTRLRARVTVGWRSNLMWHDVSTNDFYSPSRFQSHLGVAQIEGRVTAWLDYSGEAAAGFQSETNAPLLHPFQTTAKLTWHPDRHFRVIAEAAKSTSSLDRAGPGLRSYSRWMASGGIEIRLP